MNKHLVHRNLVNSGSIKGVAEGFYRLPASQDRIARSFKARTLSGFVSAVFLGISRGFGDDHYIAKIGPDPALYKPGFLSPIPDPAFLSFKNFPVDPDAVTITEGGPVIREYGEKTRSPFPLSIDREALAAILRRLTRPIAFTISDGDSLTRDLGVDSRGQKIFIFNKILPIDKDPKQPK
jgi:hypothetical protein